MSFLILSFLAIAVGGLITTQSTYSTGDDESQDDEVAQGDDTSEFWYIEETEIPIDVEDVCDQTKTSEEDGVSTEIIVSDKTLEIGSGESPEITSEAYQEFILGESENSFSCGVGLDSDLTSVYHDYEGEGDRPDMLEADIIQFSDRYFNSNICDSVNIDIPKDDDGYVHKVGVSVGYEYEFLGEGTVENSSVTKSFEFIILSDSPDPPLVDFVVKDVFDLRGEVVFEDSSLENFAILAKIDLGSIRFSVNYSAEELLEHYISATGNSDSSPLIPEIIDNSFAPVEVTINRAISSEQMQHVSFFGLAKDY